MFTRRSRWAGVALTTAVLAITTGCGSDDAATDDGVQVLAGFYPRVGGRAGRRGPRLGRGAHAARGEPHDLELTPRDVAAVEDADLLVYLAGFQPALDEAAETAGGDHTWDAGDAADLLTGDAHDDEHDAEHDAEEDAGHEDGEDHGHDHGDDVVDPHFWLDPARLADVADALADRLTELDPEGADTFTTNAAALRADLEALDDELRAGLADCAVSTVVTAHDAFGYLAERYGLEVVGINGLSPSAEPSPAQLATISRLVSERGVTTVYTEALVDPAVAETVASEAGARTAVLDPVEGLSDDSAGEDYLEVMRSNLATLRDGQSCS